MSKRNEYTDEEIDALLDAVEEFMSFSMAHMMLGSLGIAADDKKVVDEFVSLYRRVYCKMTGVSEKDAGLTVIEEFTGNEVVSTDEGSKPSGWGQSGDIRPSKGKLH